MTVALTVAGWWIAAKITLRGVQEAHVREVRSREWEHDLAEVYRPLHAQMEKLLAEEPALAHGHSLGFENGDFAHVREHALLADRRHGPLREDIEVLELRVVEQGAAARAYHKRRDDVVRGQWQQVLARDEGDGHPQRLAVFLKKDKGLEKALGDALARGDREAWEELYADAKSRRTRGPAFELVATTFDAMFDEAGAAAAPEREAFERASREAMAKARRIRDGISKSIQEEKAYVSVGG